MVSTEQIKQSNVKFNNSPSKGNIVLIHGLWMTDLSWEHWKKFYEDKGYNVYTPTWAELEGRTIEEIRNNPDLLSGVGIEEIFNHLANEIKKIDSPILMGHSFGGLFVQKLLNIGIGSCGVAIDSAQTKGVLRLPLKTIKAAWPALKNPFDVNGIVDLSFDEFKYSFANGVPEEDARAGYDRYYIPSPKRPLIQVGLSNFAPHAVNKVDYHNPVRPPLLFIAGEIDRLTPPSVNKENCYRYHTNSRTDFKLYKGRSHFTVAQRGWEKVADYCLNWAKEQAQQETMVLH